jgi:hypothetical protein
MGRRFFCFLAFGIWAVGAAGAAGPAAQTADCHAKLMKWADKHGFRVQTSDGTELYCRDIIILGSRIPYTECGTEEELASYAFQVDQHILSRTCKD